MRSQSISIAFVYNGLASFVSRDLELLKSHFKVFPIECSSALSFWKTFVGVYRSEVSVSWFASKKSALAVLFSKLFNKKSIIITGGSMVLLETPQKAREKGAFYPWTFRLCAEFSAKYADLLLPVSEYEAEGIRHFYPDSKVSLCYHGFDYTKFLPAGEKQNIVLTVTQINREYLIRKRLKDIVIAAKLLPQLKFVLVGASEGETLTSLKSISSPNVEFPGFVPFKELLALYQRAAVYLQPSTQEGFGCAIAEAMLCECTPVVSNVSAIPEVVGDCGIYLDEPITPEEIAAKVQLAMRKPKLGQQARQRVIEKFPLEKRKLELLATIESIGEKSC